MSSSLYNKLYNNCFQSISVKLWLAVYTINCIIKPQEALPVDLINESYAFLD